MCGLSRGDARRATVLGEDEARPSALAGSLRLSVRGRRRPGLLELLLEVLQQLSELFQDFVARPVAHPSTLVLAIHQVLLETLHISVGSMRRHRDQSPTKSRKNGAASVRTGRRPTNNYR